MRTGETPPSPARATPNPTRHPGWKQDGQHGNLAAPWHVEKERDRNKRKWDEVTLGQPRRGLLCSSYDLI